MRKEQPAWAHLAEQHISDEGVTGTLARALATCIQLDDELLTDDEKEALRLTGQLAGLMSRIIYKPSREATITMQGRLRQIADQDSSEMAHEIHAIQHRIMAQAAARQFPSEYRLMGSIING